MRRLRLGSIAVPVWIRSITTGFLATTTKETRAKAVDELAQEPWASAPWVASGRPFAARSTSVEPKAKQATRDAHGDGDAERIVYGRPDGAEVECPKHVDSFAR